MADTAAADGTTEVRRDMERTRERMTETLAALDERVHETVDGVKRKVDVMGLVREHPWPALGLALGLGVALAATGSDRRAVAATAGAARAAGRSARDGARGLIHGDDDATPTSDGDRAPRRGIVGAVDDAVYGLFHEVFDGMRGAAEEFAASLARK